MSKTGAWRTSTFSSAGGSCVEVSPGPWAVLVRDTKDGGLGPILVLDRVAWTTLQTAAVTRRPGAAGSLRITTGEQRTLHAGSWTDTNWHVTVAGLNLHFTDSEWLAFALGVREGEFEFAPVP